MRNSVSVRTIALSVGLTAALLFANGCGGKSEPPKTYLYVGKTDFSSRSNGSVDQFRVEDDGTLTAIAPSTPAGVDNPYAAAVTPSNQHLFIVDADGALGELGIDSNGILATNAHPAAKGISIAFTPDNRFAVIPDPWDATLSSFDLGHSGVLAPTSALALGDWPQSTVVDQSGRFAYVSSWNDGTISEYTISPSGLLVAIGSISTDGANPWSLVVSPAGFLYCANANSGSVTEFSIDTSTGALTVMNNFSIFAQPEVGPWWIIFDPTGTHAYAGNPDEIAQFAVSRATGMLTRIGTVSSNSSWGAVDPSGRFLFSTGAESSVSRFIINNTGTLVPNGSVSLGPNFVGGPLTFAQR